MHSSVKTVLLFLSMLSLVACAPIEDDIDPDSEGVVIDDEDQGYQDLGYCAVDTCQRQKDDCLTERNRLCADCLAYCSGTTCVSCNENCRAITCNYCDGEEGAGCGRFDFRSLYDQPLYDACFAFWSASESAELSEYLCARFAKIERPELAAHYLCLLESTDPTECDAIEEIDPTFICDAAYERFVYPDFCENPEQIDYMRQSLSWLRPEVLNELDQCLASPSQAVLKVCLEGWLEATMPWHW